MDNVIRDPNYLFATPHIELVRRPDGSMRMRSLDGLLEYPRCIGVHLEFWARTAPTRSFLAERGKDGEWRAITYSDVYRKVQGIAGSLLERGLSPQRPVVVLSENSIDHALLTLAAMHVGIPSISVSAAYSLMSADFVKLRQIISTLEPGIIYVSDAVRYERGLAAIRALHSGIVVSGSADAGSVSLPFAELESRRNVAAAETAFEAVGPMTIAKLMFTSGSTDEPKGVMVTQQMLTSNQQARAQIWPFLDKAPPIVVDWLPWSHTFGGNHNFNLVLRFGGTLYIDGGRPTPSQFAETIANLKGVSPSIYFNVPRGYDMLVSALKADADLRQRFFERLQLLFYAAAALPQHLWDALTELARQTVGELVPLVSAWGSTETAPLVTDAHFVAARSGAIGVPIPGCELKLIGNSEKLEARIRGPNVTPGYWKRPDLTAGHFDEEGFYRIGDAVRFVDPDDPARGLYFDGRIAEDFKLDTGTWVNAGMLRVKAIAALEPIAADVVLTGHDRSEIGLLVFPNISACRVLSNSDEKDSLEKVFAHPQIRTQVEAGLSTLRAARGGSSSYATRALLMLEPPSIDAGEVTDKGYINQRAVLTRRDALVIRLHQGQAPDVIHLK